MQVGDGFVSDCAHHHPVLRNRKSLRRLGIGRFCEDFRPVSFRSFDLRWRLRSSGRFGLRPKIPFSTAGSSTPDRVRLPGFLGFGRPKATFRTRSAIIADSIQGLRTAGSVLAEHREVARLRCRAAAGLRPRRARGPVRGTRAIWYGHLTHAALLDVMRYRQISVLAGSPEAIGVGPLPHETPCRRRGSRTVNSVKSPTSLSTAIVPPCCWVTIS